MIKRVISRSVEAYRAVQAHLAWERYSRDLNCHQRREDYIEAKLAYQKAVARSQRFARPRQVFARARG
jgi:hypothetical protein